jgi:hypothetical protein
MNIQEIQKAKRHLEECLRENIRVFEKETGVWVSCVHLDRWCGEQDSPLGSVRCDVRL